MTHPISFRDRPREDVILPLSLSDPSCGTTRGVAEICSVRAKRGVACLTFAERKPDWISDFEYFVFAVGPDGTRKAIRKATNRDIRDFRVPMWVQSQEVPMCCGSEMVFVGQIDDGKLCHEVPAGAKMWWHDAASFYVFTCPKCLAVAAVGQQY